MELPEIREKLRERLAVLESRIVDACTRVGRARGEVTLIAVTKTTTAEVAGLLPELGVFDLGESRPQELARKATELAGRGIRWHMIGQLQTNKIKQTIESADLLHSVDRMRLLEELGKQGRPIRILLEVNASREEAKHGFTPEELPGIVAMLPRYGNLHLDGLMTMAAQSPDPEDSRPAFREVRELRDKLGLKELSMGMSNDLHIAIEEGATLIRPGSALFE